MPDNSAKIAKIRSLLETGVSSTAVGDVSNSIDRESLRKELRRLEAEDDTLRSKRPPVATIDLSGLF